MGSGTAVVVKVGVVPTCIWCLVQISLDAEISGSSMLIDSLNKRVSHVAFFFGMFCTRVDRNLAPHLGFVLWVSCCWG